MDVQPATNTDQPTNSVQQDENDVSQLIMPTTPAPVDDASAAPADNSAPASPDTTTKEVTPVVITPDSDDDEDRDDGQAEEVTPPVTEESKTEEPKEEEPATEVTPTMPVIIPAGGSAGDSELLEVKQQALTQLTPLVDKLDLPADEKFDTYMMIIRASDDTKLIKPAFEAAQAIADDDKKAQALLDVVNEINYLTQPDDGPKS